MLTRRHLIGVVSLTAAGAAWPAHAQDLPLPDPKTFQSGDFIWPKKPGMYVPYNATVRADPREEQRRWEQERDAFLANAPATAPYFSAADLASIKALSYREFYSRYVGDQAPDTPGVYSSGGGIYVGHVGIIEIDGSGVPWVIEALMQDGVGRRTYQDWLKGRSQEIVWHGRVREIAAEDRAKIAAEAKKHLGRPYDFWNFDLSDDKAFYCSKLAWLAISRSLGFAIDGNSDPKRRFWFSPKQFLYLKTIGRLHDPGPYATQ
jgi:hypothetical protein